MDKLKLMQAEHAKQVAEMRSMLALAEKDDRSLTEEEQTSYDALDTSTDTLAGKIDTEKKLLAKEASAKEVVVIDPNADTNINGNITFTRPAFEDDPKAGFNDMGAFAIAVQRRMDPTATEIAGDIQQLNYLAAISGMGTTVGSDGGFLLPQTFNLAIWDELNRDVDNLMTRTDNYTVDGETLTFNANAETSRATGSRWGGVRAFWLAEAEEKTKSKPTFRQMKLEPKGMAVLVYVTDKLLRGAGIALSQYLTRVASAEIAFEVSDAIIEGNGAGKPQGILTSGSLVTITKETGQAANTIVIENIVKMWSRCHSRARRNAVWYINQDIEPQLLTMTLDTGTAGIPVYMPPGGISGAPFATIFGRPVIPIEYASTLGTVGDIILADLGFYAMGTKGSTRSDMSIHLRFDFNETVFRFLFEADGQSWLASKLTPFKGGAGKATSPFVVLATRGA